MPTKKNTEPVAHDEAPTQDDASNVSLVKMQKSTCKVSVIPEAVESYEKAGFKRVD